MSLLSSALHGLFGDPSADAARAREEAAAKAAADEAKAKADKEAADAKKYAADELLRTNSTTAGRNAANLFFQNLGLNPTDYAGDIDTRIAEILGTSAHDDPNVGSYFKDLGQTIYNARQNAARTRALGDVDSIFALEFERSRISDTFDDPFIADIGNQQRAKADAYIDNLFNRHVITQTGADAARRNLDEQGSRVRTTLDDLGRGLISSGRQSLTDVANRGRLGASTLRLGQNFNPSSYGSEVDNAFNEFSSKFGDQFKSRIPGNLYDTSGLAAVAGSGQGAQNLRFDPFAVAGKPTDTYVDNSLASRPVF